MRALVIAIAACGVNQTPQPAPLPVLPSCVPNRDGTITAAELPTALGATLTYYSGTNRSVNLAGNAGVWNLADERPDDTVIALGPVALGAQWYAASFPAGQFVVDAGGGLDAIYHQDDRALWLDGTASHQMMPAAGKTLVVYATPIAALRFPLADGTAYATSAAITATIDGLPFVGTDTIDIDVTAGRELDLPYVDFTPVLRVRTHAVRAPTSGTPAAGRRTTSFLFECFGEVARAESNPNEAAADFTTAAVLRRFALGVTP